MFDGLIDELTSGFSGALAPLTDNLTQLQDKIGVFEQSFGEGFQFLLILMGILIGLTAGILVAVVLLGRRRNQLLSLILYKMERQKGINDD